jgi:ornithine cyclodeaminase/alanine dehydrogenase-like protein (mu-crystallin family)
MAANIGLALEDMAVASEIYARAQQRGIGTSLPL